MKRFWQLIVVAIMLLVWTQPVQAQTSIPQPVVRAVLFYSPSCGHCHYVITEILPTIFETYGEQFQIVGVDASTAEGQVLFQTVLLKFGLESGSVPFLVMGDTYLVGSLDIPEQLPGLIEKHLTQGGLDWPDIPGLAEAMATTQPTETPTPTVKEETSIIATFTPETTKIDPSSTPTPGLLLPINEDSSLKATFTRDLAGNSLAVIVLTGMILSAILAIIFHKRLPTKRLNQSWAWAIPIVCLIGLFVAGYLAYVEMNQMEATCGPIGDCNTVQQSEYARLFGILPIGVLGLIGYCLILIAWVIGRYTTSKPADYASLALLGMSTFGLLFSIYLTFLEPFVIGATCAWCLTSAILMTILFWLSLVFGRRAFSSLLEQ